MLYNLFEPYFNDYSFFNLFRYISFRSGGAIFTSLIISFLIMPSCIKMLSRRQTNGQPLRDDGPVWHKETKENTPTMGGLMIIFASLISAILWADMSNYYIWILVFVTLSFGCIGLLDDWLKVRQNSSRGVRGKLKILLQVIFSLIALFFLQHKQGVDFNTSISMPFFKELIFNFGWFYFIFALVVIIGASNAVNLTDGLDGLAIVPVMIVGSSFALISYIVGNKIFAGYLLVPYIEGSGEIAVFCASLVGASLGFLWFNAPPARIFMGDTGSLALGGVSGMASVITRNEVTLAIIGGLFVLEAVSVIIQVYSFKLTGKRVFRMAPIHHHFEKKGWAEPTIVIRFWIISIILAIIGLSTLKIR
jgi:phospho-N-acetylmuramoyl-pentapeptide-transferase